jgi:ferritin-like metal-binding protein YciE
MKIVSQNFRNLRALYINQLRLLLSAEEQIVRALPDMMNAATDDQLSDAFRSHYQETDIHVKRLEDLLANLKSSDPGMESTAPIRCKAVHGLIAETEDMLEDARDAFVKDAALIAAAQRIEHYEIAAYGAVRQFAWVLGESAAADALDLTIKEEGHADHLLTQIAERINEEAKHGRDAVMGAPIAALATPSPGGESD